MSKIRAKRKAKNFFITGSNVSGLVNATTVSSSIFTKMSQSFADGEHLIDTELRETQGAILFMLQELQDDVDDIFTQVSASQYAPLSNSELQATTGSYTILNLGGTNVTSTATELNKMDGNTAASNITPVDADRVVYNDNGTMRQVTLTKLATYFDDEITNMPNLTSVGTLNSLDVDKHITASGNISIGGDFLNSQTIQLTAASSTVINTFNTSSFQTCKYLLQVTSASVIQSSELLVMQTGSNAFNTEYAQMNSGVNLGSFATSVSGANVKLNFAADFISCSVKFNRTLI